MEFCAGVAVGAAEFMVAFCAAVAVKFEFAPFVAEFCEFFAEFGKEFTEFAATFRTLVIAVSTVALSKTLTPFRSMKCVISWRKSRVRRFAP